MTIEERNQRFMEGDELFANLEKLKERVMYYDDFLTLPKERQAEVYKFCKRNGHIDACRENLKQIRFAVTQIYFGW